jgi:hypothetical protein
MLIYKYGIGYRPRPVLPPNDTPAQAHPQNRAKFRSTCYQSGNSIVSRHNLHEHVPPQETGEIPMASKAKSTKAKKASKTTAKKANGGTGGTVNLSKIIKSAKVIALMKRAKGVTRAEVLELTGWKAVSMQQLAKSGGVKLKIDKKEKPYRYLTEG